LESAGCNGFQGVQKQGAFTPKAFLPNELEQWQVFPELLLQGFDILPSNFRPKVIKPLSMYGETDIGGGRATIQVFRCQVNHSPGL
jgi:hypothetical protein